MPVKNLLKHSLPQRVRKKSQNILSLVRQSANQLLHKTEDLHPQMSCLVTKPTKWHVRPAKIQISLGIHPV